MLNCFIYNTIPILNHTNLEKLPVTVGFIRRHSLSGSPLVNGLGILNKKLIFLGFYLNNDQS